VDYIVKECEAGKTLEESAAALDAGLGTHSLMFCICQLQAAYTMIVRWVKRRHIFVDAPDDPEAMPLRCATLARHRYIVAGQQRRFPPNRGITIDGVPGAQWVPNRHVGWWEATAITGPDQLTGFENDFV
jgi:hypothetical protein